MKRQFTLNIFKSHEEGELFELLEDAALSPTEKFFQGRQLVRTGYRMLGMEFPETFEPVISIGKLGEEDESERLIFGIHRNAKQT